MPGACETISGGGNVTSRWLVREGKSLSTKFVGISPY